MTKDQGQMTFAQLKDLLDSHKIAYGIIGDVTFNPPLPFFQDAPKGTQFIVVPGGGARPLQFGYSFSPDGSFREFGIWE